jgi:hypothetical protein
MPTLEKEVVATCIAKTLVASCNRFAIFYFSFKVQGPNPNITFDFFWFVFNANFWFQL